MKRVLLHEKREGDLTEAAAKFISAISHEFRTPMSTILSSAELLEHYGEQMAPNRKIEHLRQIQESIIQMSGFLDYLLVQLNEEVAVDLHEKDSGH